MITTINTDGKRTKIILIPQNDFEEIIIKQMDLSKLVLEGYRNDNNELTIEFSETKQR